jgi:hypothetical protein
MVSFPFFLPTASPLPQLNARIKLYASFQITRCDLHVIDPLKRHNPPLIAALSDRPITMTLKI